MDGFNFLLESICYPCPCPWSSTFTTSTLVLLICAVIGLFGFDMVILYRIVLRKYERAQLHPGKGSLPLCRTKGQRRWLQNVSNKYTRRLRSKWTTDKTKLKNTESTLAPFERSIIESAVQLKRSRKFTLHDENKSLRTLYMNRKLPADDFQQQPEQVAGTSFAKRYLTKFHYSYPGDEEVSDLMSDCGTATLAPYRSLKDLIYLRPIDSLHSDPHYTVP